MYTIIVSKELKEACPVFAGAAIYAEVKNTSYCKDSIFHRNAHCNNPVGRY